MTRIRYKQTRDPNVLVSVKEYTSNNNRLLQLYIIKEALSYELRDGLTGDVMEHGVAATMHDVKKRAKATLLKYIPDFIPETRNKRASV